MSDIVLCSLQWMVYGFRYCWPANRSHGRGEGAGVDVDQCVVADAAHQEAEAVCASVRESTPECFTVSNLSACLYALLQEEEVAFTRWEVTGYLQNNSSCVLIVALKFSITMEPFILIPSRFWCFSSIQK